MAGRRRKRTFWSFTPHSCELEGVKCRLCGQGPGSALHLLPLPGLETAVEERLNVKAAGFQLSFFDMQ